MAFVKNADNILIGTGKVYINNVSIGQLSGQIRSKVGNEWYKVEAGFPAQAVKQALIKESGEIAFNLLEIDLGTIRSLMPQFQAVTTSTGASDEIVEELVIYDGRVTHLKHGHITEFALKTNPDSPASPADLDEGVDYHFDPVIGTFSLITDSEKAEDEDAVKATYKHQTFKGAGFGVGGGTTTGETFEVQFWHKKSDGTYLCQKFWKCQVEGDFEMVFEESAHTTLPILLTVLADSTKPAGQQLYTTMVYDDASAIPDGVPF